MNRRIKKKEWKKQTTEQQADLLKRVAALEKLTRGIVAEQNCQREHVTSVVEELDSYQNAVYGAMRQAADRRRRRQRAALEREMERQQKRETWARMCAFAAFGLALLAFAFWLPV